MIRALASAADDDSHTSGGAAGAAAGGASAQGAGHGAAPKARGKKAVDTVLSGFNHSLDRVRGWATGI